MCIKSLTAFAAFSVIGLGCGIEFLHALAFGVLISGGLSVTAVMGRTKTFPRDYKQDNPDGS